MYSICKKKLFLSYAGCSLYYAQTLLQVSYDRNDPRLYFPLRSSEISRYMDAMWRLKETQKDKR